MISLSISESKTNPTAVADNLIKLIKMGITKGKLKIANSPAPFLAFAAIAEVKVKVIAKPKLDNSITIIKSPMSLTGFPATRDNAPNETAVKTKSNKVL